jgi:hypothetical protein
MKTPCTQTRFLSMKEITDGLAPLEAEVLRQTFPEWDGLPTACWERRVIPSVSQVAIHYCQPL